MKKTTPLIYLIPVMVLMACEDHDLAPVPVTPKLRPHSISYGELSYRILNYDVQGRVANITAGLIADGDSIETQHQIVYNGDRIDKITVTDKWKLEYLYEDDRLSETHEYNDGVLTAAHVYLYDDAGRVRTWGVMHPDGENMVPFTKTTYAYGADGNLVTLKHYYYQVSAFKLMATITYEDFDDKKESSVAFLTDLYNPQQAKFKNNPRVWRVVNASGATTEEHFSFEYNDLGYTTRSRPASGGQGIVYRFAEY